jgi:hypothetical protein
MDDGRAPRCGALDCSAVEQVRALDEIKPHDFVPASLEALYDAKTDLAAMAGDEDAHGDRIALSAFDYDRPPTGDEGG